MKLSCPLKKIHFIGIGGIGMSAIAEMLVDLGLFVQGSDAKESANTKRVQKSGIPVFIGHKKENLKGVDAVVISSAIKPDNPELLEARRLGIPVGHRSEMLAEILNYKRSICVSGTHGKTTTSSLLASILMQAKLKPSFVIGGILNSQSSNARLGKGDYVVVEADESDGSFLKLPTTISVVTNIDPEHMDHYKTFDNMKKAYALFIQNTAFYGFSVVCTDHETVKEVIKDIDTRRIVSYGLNKQADVHADHIRMGSDGIIFDVFVRNGAKFKKIKDVKLAMFGKHNVLNALAAIAVSLRLGISESVIKKALSTFEGIQRRLTLRGVLNKVKVYDDYAHHPIEIKATLEAVKSSVKGKIVAVFQPHRYSRFSDLWDDFLTCFSAADEVLVLDVYAAGETMIPGVTAPAFVQGLGLKGKKASYLASIEGLKETASLLSPSDTIVCLGAGSISAEVTQLLKKEKGLKK